MKNSRQSKARLRLLAVDVLAQVRGGAETVHLYLKANAATGTGEG